MSTRRHFVQRLATTPAWAWALASMSPAQAAGTSAMTLSQLVANDLSRWDQVELHRTGTQGDADTARWLAQEIGAMGLEPRIDEFAFRQRTPGLCSVTDGINEANGLPMFDGGSTGFNPIVGRCGPLQSDAPIGITSYGTTTRDASTQTLRQARRRGQHQIIVASANVGANVPGLAVLNAESYRRPYGPPVLQVATEHQTWLQTAAKKAAALSVHAQLSERIHVASNVEITIKGQQPHLAPVVVMTPRSGWWTSTSERGGGVTVWLNAIRMLAKQQPVRSVLFTANTGHELGHAGLDHFLGRSQSLVRGAHVWVHLGANFAAKNAPVVWQASSEQYQRMGLNALADQGIARLPMPIAGQLAQSGVIAQPVGQRPLGEARNIFDGGGQFISLLGTNQFFHHPQDRLVNAVDLAKTTKLTHMMLSMISQVANQA